MRFGAMRVRDGALTVLTVAAIVLASMIGLNTWADAMATQTGTTDSGG